MSRSVFNDLCGPHNGVIEDTTAFVALETRCLRKPLLDAGLAAVRAPEEQLLSRSAVDLLNDGEAEESFFVPQRDGIPHGDAIVVRHRAVPRVEDVWPVAVAGVSAVLAVLANRHEEPGREFASRHVPSRPPRCSVRVRAWHSRATLS